MHRIHLLLSSAAIAAAIVPQLAAAQTNPQAPAAQEAPKPSSDRSNDVVVSGKRSDVVAAPDRMIYNVEGDLHAQTGTMADALRAVPGVEVDLEGRVSLRGDPGVTILIDGRPSAAMRGDGRGEALLAMPAGRIARIEVITNPSASMSPEGSGGIINLVTKPARANTTAGTVRATLGEEGRRAFNLNGSYAKAPLTLTGDLGYRRFTTAPSGTQVRSRFDTGTNSFMDSQQDIALRNVALSRTGRLAIEYDIDKTNRFTAELTGRDMVIDSDRTDMFSGAVPSASYVRVADARMSNRGAGLSTSWRRTLPGKDHELVVEAEAEQSWLDRDINSVTTFAATAPVYERIENEADRREYRGKVDYKRPLAEGQSLNLGYEITASQTAFGYFGARGGTAGALTPVPSLTNQFDYDQTVHAAYGTFDFRLGKLEVRTGLRFEQADLMIDQITDGVRIDRGYFRAYPTLHLGYELSASQRLRASYSRRIQRPSPQDLNPYVLYIDSLNLRRGNPFLRPETTDSFELAWQIRKDGAFYSVTPFYRLSRDGVTDVTQEQGGGIFLTTRTNLTTAQRAGVDFVANGKLSKTLSYNVSGSVLWNRIDPKAGGISAPREGTTGMFRVNLTWQPTGKDYFQLNGTLSGDQLLPQGYRSSSGILNLGYRHKFNDRVSLVMTGQNVLGSAQQVIVIETPTLRDRLTQRGPGRIVLIGISVNLGGQSTRRRQEPGFEFDQGAISTN
jgi:outer membrane receptor protein involved in Fe transport